MHFSSFSLAESKPREMQILPANNGLLMRSTVQLCFAANSILLMRNWNHALV